MTIAIRVDDLAPGWLPRRAKLYEILGFCGIHPYKVKQNRGMYFIVMEHSKIEQALDERCKESLRQENFIIQTPLEYNAFKTIVAKQLDQIIDFYEDESIIQNIERTNEWCKVESIYKLKTSSKITKIRFKTTEMAKHALQDGLYILNQKIPRRNIEKEVFIMMRTGGEACEAEEISRPVEEVWRVTPSSSDVSLPEAPPTTVTSEAEGYKSGPRGQGERLCIPQQSSQVLPSNNHYLLLFLPTTGLQHRCHPLNERP